MKTNTNRSCSSITSIIISQKNQLNMHEEVQVKNRNNNSQRKVEIQKH